MPIHLRQLTISLLAVCALASCSDSEEPPVPTPVPEPPVTNADPPGTVGERRTILIYMVANNNLGTPSDYTYQRYDRQNMAQMEEYAAEQSLNGCNVIVFYEPRDTDPQPTLLQLSSDGFRTVKTYPRFDSGTYAVDPDVMQQVIGDVKSMYPAREYGLILWSHAFGWLTDADTLPTVRSWGMDRGKNMSIPALARGVGGPQSPLWDFIYFDCCFMMNAECLYELRDAARWFIGSSTEIPAAGMPYRENMPHLTASTLSPESIASTTFAHYDALSGSARSCTMSVVDASRLDDLAKACRDVYLSGATFSGLRRDIINFSATMSSTSQRDFTYDMAQYFHSLSPLDPALAAEFDTALSSAVTYRSNTPMMWDSFSLEGYCGLGHHLIATPDDMTYAISRGYGDLQWHQDVTSHIF